MTNVLYIGYIRPETSALVMKTLLLSFLFLFSISILKAQNKKQNVYFLKNDNVEVAVRDSADFIRIIQEPDSGETNFVVHEFYKNGQKKLMAKVSKFEPFLVFEGSAITYFDNGVKKDIINYKNGKPIEKGFFYFKNGKLKKQFEYLPDDSNAKLAPNPNSMQFPNEPMGKVIYLADSLEKVFVKDGNGRAVELSKEKDDEFIEEGDYKDGVKSGIWVGKYHSGKSSYEETYQVGKLLSGKSVKDGITYSYNVLGTPPVYKRGVGDFYQYLGRSIRYPLEEAKRNVSGTVALAFVVEKDGAISDIKVLRSVSPSIDEEAIRVVRYSPKWQPATYRGLPVRVKYNLPVTFSLGR